MNPGGQDEDDGSSRANEALLRASQRLLEYAGRAAFNMPRLETMEIWQTYTHEESIFRYEAFPDPTVAFLSRFDMQPMWTVEAQRAWEAAAFEKNKKPLVVKFEMLPPHPDQFCETCYIFGTIKKLKLRDLVVDPVSLYAGICEEYPLEANTVTKPNSTLLEDDSPAGDEVSLEYL